MAFTDDLPSTKRFFDCYYREPEKNDIYTYDPQVRGAPISGNSWTATCGLEKNFDDVTRANRYFLSFSYSLLFYSLEYRAGSYDFSRVSGVLERVVYIILYEENMYIYGLGDKCAARCINLNKVSCMTAVSVLPIYSLYTCFYIYFLFLIKKEY